ncbi:MAG: TMEM165/GDT1 family protein [Coleofasciculaceae cyanobacterium]
MKSSLPVASPVLSVPPTIIEPSESHLRATLAANDAKPQALGHKKRVWSIFSSTFLTIFLAEIGDKTQLATLLMSAESQSPWTVFAGAAMALITTSLLGVLIGRWLSQRLSPKTLNRSAGLLLLFISVMLFWDVFH